MHCTLQCWLGLNVGHSELIQLQREFLSPLAQHQGSLTQGDSVRGDFSPGFATQECSAYLDTPENNESMSSPSAESTRLTLPLFCTMGATLTYKKRSVGTGTHDKVRDPSPLHSAQKMFPLMANQQIHRQRGTAETSELSNKSRNKKILSQQKNSTTKNLMLAYGSLKKLFCNISLSKFTST